MSERLEEVAGQVAEIIRRVGKRSEIEDEVAENVGLSDLARELVGEEGPVRAAAIEAVTRILSDLDVEAGSDLETSIIDAVEWPELVKTLTDDPEVKAGLRKAALTAIEGGTENNDSFTGVVDEAFGLNDADLLVKALGPETKSQLDELVGKKVRAYLEEANVEGLDEDTLIAVRDAVFTSDRVVSALATKETEVVPLIATFVRSAIEKCDPEDRHDLLLEKVLESPILKQEIDLAVANIARNGQISRLIEQAVERILQDQESPLRSHIEAAVSRGIVDKIASQVVSRLFERRQ